MCLRSFTSPTIVSRWIYEQALRLGSVKLNKPCPHETYAMHIRYLAKSDW